MADRGIRAGKAFVELWTDNNPLVKGLRAASSVLHGWGNSVALKGGLLAGAGAAITGPLAAAVGRFTVFGSEIKDAADRLGSPAGPVSLLKFAAEQSAVGFDTLQTSAGKLLRTVGDAAGGGKEAAQALAALGLSAAGLKDLSLDEQFLAVADALAKVENPADRLNRAFGLFGRSAQTLMPLLGGGADGLRELLTKGRRFGALVSQEDADAAEAFGDALDLAKTALDGIVRAAGGAVAKPLLAGWLSNEEDIGKAVEKTRQWVEANSAVIAGAAAGGVALTALGTATLGAGLAIKTVAVGAGVLAGAIAAATSSVGLLVGAAGGLGYVWATQTENGRAFASEVGAGFRSFADDAVASWAAVQAAFGAGELNLAFGVVSEQLKVTWLQTTQFMELTWAKFVIEIGRMWDALGTNLRMEANRLGEAWQLALHVGPNEKERAAKLRTLDQQHAHLSAFQEKVRGMPQGPDRDRAVAEQEEWRQRLERERQQILKGEAEIFRQRNAQDKELRDAHHRRMAERAAEHAVAMAMLKAEGVLAEMAAREGLDAARARARAAADAAENVRLWDDAFAAAGKAGGRRDPFAGLDQQIAAAKGSFGTHALGRSLGGTEPIQQKLLAEAKLTNVKLDRLIQRSGPEVFTDWPPWPPARGRTPVPGAGRGRRNRPPPPDPPRSVPLERRAAAGRGDAGRPARGCRRPVRGCRRPARGCRRPARGAVRPGGGAARGLPPAAPADGGGGPGQRGGVHRGGRVGRPGVSFVTGECRGV